MPLFFSIAIVLAALHVAMGHLAPFHKGMYCLNVRISFIEFPRSSPRF